MWKRGILVMPPIVNQLVKAMQVSPALFHLFANVMLCQIIRSSMDWMWGSHRAKLARCFCKWLQTGSKQL